MFDSKLHAVIGSAFVLLGLALSGCGGSPDTAASTQVVAQCGDGQTLTICGTPSTSITQGLSYSFVPTTGGGSGALNFGVTNMPPWASLDSGTGALTGTPDIGDAGMTFSGIVISVNSGSESDSLAAFDITVLGSATGVATLSWTAPTENEDGTLLNDDLAGYKVYYGPAVGDYPNSMTIANATVTTSMVENLSPGTWVFAVTAFDKSFNESGFSNTATMAITSP